MISPPPKIDEKEVIGRGVFDSTKAKKADNGKIPPRVFRGKTGVRELSVDRLSFGSHVELAELHDQERSPQKFYGWAKLTIKDAVNNGRMVVPRPIEAINPYHAEIVLPDMKDLDASEEQDQHALSLAMSATWLPRPASKQESAATTS